MGLLFKCGHYHLNNTFFVKFNNQAHYAYVYVCKEISLTSTPLGEVLSLSLSRNLLNLKTILQVPKCYALKYVRVLVNNRATSPAVRFDEKRRIVAIEYKDQQPGVTTFTVMVKGRTLWDCYNKSNY